ncbi:hypothetical protein GCM10007304_17920 [Rhodococcoides trifolii]|uniref:Uncharacterized protein n=1 Tax=Rhodococcoides trifolii TaxID=908250 RepID=A0A917D1I2_9NOCA|nr:hypothetical protein [Rhodococcus trifolii]GGG04227.1 hypothetical protein GCM10007304_17920 [Rhodococcus trifolii]
MRIYFEVDVPDTVGSFDAEQKTDGQWLVHLRRFGTDEHAGCLIRVNSADPFEVIRQSLNHIHQQGPT